MQCKSFINVFMFHLFPNKQAYCLYRRNKLDESLESLKSQEGTYATMLSESHILYRLGKMDACIDIYQKL